MSAAATFTGAYAAEQGSLFPVDKSGNRLGEATRLVEVGVV